MTDEHGARPGGGTPPLLEQLRDGWHSLGGGQAAACPGCPVCRLTESAGRLDPVAAEHLHSALGHLTQAGREVLAALGRLPSGPAGPSGPSDPRPADAPRADPGTEPAPARTRIPVVTQDHQPQDHQSQQHHEEQA